MIIWNIILTLAVIALAWVVWHLWQFMAGVEAQDDHWSTEITERIYKHLEPKPEDIERNKKRWPCNNEDSLKGFTPIIYDPNSCFTREISNDEIERINDWVFKTEDRVDDK